MRGRPVSQDGRHRQISINLSEDAIIDLEGLGRELGRNRSETVAFIIAFAKAHRLDHIDDFKHARRPDAKEKTDAREARAEAARIVNERKRARAESSLDGFVIEQPEDWQSPLVALARYNRTFKCWILPKTRKAAGKALADPVVSLHVFASLDDFAAGRRMTQGERGGWLRRWKLR